jgi:hypothetical protein
LFFGGIHINEDRERIKIIEQLLSYKLGLEKSKPELLEALAEYYSDKKESNNVLGINNGLKDLEFLSYDNAYEAYILTQIKIVESLPSVINDHIFMFFIIIQHFINYLNISRVIFNQQYFYVTIFFIIS